MQTIGKYDLNNRMHLSAIICQLVEQPQHGCLQIFSGSMSWTLYIEEGKLIYATYSDNMFELMYKKLKQLSMQISSISSDIYKRLLSRFEAALEPQ